MVLRLAFGHKARSGKDTAAEYISRKIGVEFVNVKFTTKLYDTMYLVQNFLGLPQEKDPKLLQWLGTDYGRAIDPDFWVKRTEVPVDMAAVVTDLRFPNEADHLKKLGFVLIKVNRPDRPIDRDPTHISETALDNYEGWDYIIDNTGTLEDFHQKLDILLEKIQAV